MGYRREEGANNSTIFTPDEPRESDSWLKSVSIDRPGDEPPIVRISVDKSKGFEADRALDVLVGAKMLLENLKIKPPAAALVAGVVPYDASVKSQIGSVLSTAQIPHDMAEAIMGELQKSWKK